MGRQHFRRLFTSEHGLMGLDFYFQLNFLVGEENLGLLDKRQW